MADEYIQGVVSLLHCNGADGSKSFKDSATALPWAVTGDVALSTTQSKFGGTSFYKGATGNHYISTPSRPELNMEGYDFTVELWVYPIAFALYNFPIAKISGANYSGFRIGYESNGALYVSCSGASNAAATPAGTIVADQWQHLALTRQLGVARFFVNGVLKGTWTDNNVIYNDVPVYLGQDASDGWNGFTGYIDEVRITKGQCRYTTDFTPPDAPFDNPPQWWDAAPNLTPVVAWDAGRVDGATLIDGVGDNNLVAVAPLTDTQAYPNRGVKFSNASFTTPVAVPLAGGVIAGWISTYEGDGFTIQGTGQYQTIYFQGSDYWMDNYARQYFATEVGDKTKPQFVAFVYRETYGELYIDGEILENSMPASPYNGNGAYPIMGYSLGNLTLNPTSANNKYFHACAVLTGNATLEDLRKLEKAARTKLQYGGNTTYRGFAPLLGRTDSNLPQLTLPNPAPPRFVGAKLIRRDYQFGGKGHIAGTVKEKGTPDQPLQRRVQLYDECSKIMTREVWSDPVTGAYLFENIDPNLTYSIISYDYTGMYRAVIANGQKATT